MKLSVREMGFVNPAEAKVYLDGVEERNCISLDTNARTLTRYKVDSAGKIVVSVQGDLPETETVSGHIKVVFESKPL